MNENNYDRACLASRVATRTLLPQPLRRRSDRRGKGAFHRPCKIGHRGNRELGSHDGSPSWAHLPSASHFGAALVAGCMMESAPNIISRIS